MARILPVRVAITWLVVLALTVVNPILHGVGEIGEQLLAVVILGIAVVKVRLVGLDFMELRRAPVAMRSAFEAYCLILWAVLTACFLWL